MPAKARSCRPPSPASTHRHGPQALGFLYVDGHVRVYSGTRDLPKTHIARLHMAARATNETWVADAFADPVLMVTATPGASLAAELTRLLPDLRTLVGAGRGATVIFDRGGWSPTLFAAIIEAGFDLITYRKAPYDSVDPDVFTDHVWVDPDGRERGYRLADTTVVLPLPPGHQQDTVTLRQVCRLADDGAQIPVLTSRTDLAAAEVCWRLSAQVAAGELLQVRPARISLSTPWIPTPTPPMTATGSSPAPRNTLRRTQSSRRVPDSRGRRRRWPQPSTTPSPLPGNPVPAGPRP